MSTYLAIGRTKLGWWQALNPAIYLISVLPALAVISLADARPQTILHLIQAAVGVVLIQHGINLLNDVMDWKKGADIEKYNSWIHFHNEKLGHAKLHGIVSICLGLAAGFLTLYLAGSLRILLLALPLVFLGYLYNSGSKPLAYSSLSEWATGLCYGPGVFGCLWLLSGTEGFFIGAMGSIAFGCLAVAVLLSHQPGQVLTDAMVGKRSFAVRYGVEKTKFWSKALFVLFLGMMSTAFASKSADFRILISLLGLTIGITWWLKHLIPSPRLFLLAALSFLLVSGCILQFGGVGT